MTRQETSATTIACSRHQTTGTTGGEGGGWETERDSDRENQWIFYETNWKSMETHTDKKTHIKHLHDKPT